MWLPKYRIGTRIVANVDIRITPWDAEDGVAAGDHGEVIDVDPETGDLAILMDRLIPALVDRKYLFIDAGHLCQIRPEADPRSVLHFAAKPFGVAFAASAAFLVVMTAGTMSRQTHHRAYENRFSSSSLAANATTAREQWDRPVETRCCP